MGLIANRILSGRVLGKWDVQYVCRRLRKHWTCKRIMSDIEKGAVKPADLVLSDLNARQLQSYDVVHIHDV